MTNRERAHVTARAKNKRKAAQLKEKGYRRFVAWVPEEIILRMDDICRHHGCSRAEYVAQIVKAGHAQLRAERNGGEKP